MSWLKNKHADIYGWNSPQTQSLWCISARNVRSEAQKTDCWCVRKETSTEQTANTGGPKLNWGPEWWLDELSLLVDLASWKCQQTEEEDRGDEWFPAAGGPVFFFLFMEKCRCSEEKCWAAVRVQQKSDCAQFVQSFIEFVSRKTQGRMNSSPGSDVFTPWPRIVFFSQLTHWSWSSDQKTLWSGMRGLHWIRHWRGCCHATKAGLVVEEMLQIQRRTEAAAGYREKSGFERQTSQRVLSWFWPGPRCCSRTLS